MSDARRSGMLTPYLEKAPNSVFVLYAIFAAFWTYFCMYAFRKPFSAAQYEGLSFFGTQVNLKTALVISQIIGYALSKYIGIKVCSEITPGRRAGALVGLVLFAHLSLIVFGLLPDNLKFIAIFFNGLPLGMVWGMVVWYLEGRRTSELLLAGLSCSFIIASGVVKDVGRWLMSAEGWGVSEGWMPAITGALFLLPFLICVWLLSQLPGPTQADEDARTHREPMDGVHRLAFIKHFLPGMVMLALAYFFLTAYRDFRDNYGVEIFYHFGYTDEDLGLFTQSETWVAFAVMGALAALNLIKNNRYGLIGAYAIMVTGLILMGGSTFLLDREMITGFQWMVLIGIGAYLAYVPYGSVLFDRLIASTRVVGTAVFAIYVADAIGYTGSVGVQLFNDFSQTELSHFEFLRRLTYFMAFFGTVMLVGSCLYFLLRHHHHANAPGIIPAPAPGLSPENAADAKPTASG